MKILKNIEDKENIKDWKMFKSNWRSRKKQLNGIKNISKGSKLPKAIVSFSRLGLGAKKLIDEIKEEQNAINFEKLLGVKTDGKTHFTFGIFEDPQKLAWDIYYKGSLKDAKDDQCKMFTLMNDLRNYKQTTSDKIREKKNIN